MPSDRLFGPSLSTEAMLAVVSEVAWLQRMLDFESALARAEAAVGLIPPEAAEAITAGCRASAFDVAGIGSEAAASGSPVVPLLKALTVAIPAGAAGYLHWGATSQDVVDTAMMLIARDALDLVAGDLDRAAAACAGLAERHRSTLMAGRTLLQQALPITFGLKAAGWLAAILDARHQLLEFRAHRLAIQFGGAAGTLAALGPNGLEVSRRLSLELGLAEPVLPWHTARGRVLELSMVLGLAAGTFGKIALDVVLMSQTEVGEVAERSGTGRGGSSTLPQKRNPVGSVAVAACVRGVNAQVQVLVGAMSQEHERAAGGWQAEWAAISEAFRLTAGAVGRGAEVLEGLTIDAGRMRANLDAAHGLPMSEQVMMRLAPGLGRLEAQRLVEAAAADSISSGRPFREALLAEPAVSSRLGAAGVDEALDPDGYLGSAGALIDRTLARYHAERSANA